MMFCSWFLVLWIGVVKLMKCVGLLFGWVGSRVVSSLVLCMLLM